MSSPSFFRRRPFLSTILFIFAISIGALYGSIFALYHDLPSIRELRDYRPNVVTKILDRNGEQIAELFIEKRVWTPYRRLPKNLKDALLAVEDAHFFDHGGVRIFSILRALVVDIKAGRMAQGGSTITQQLAKQLFLTSEKTVTRKIKEALLAIHIENNYTKEKILEIYCNQIYLGAGAYGFETAADIYFKKPVEKLSLVEAALLSGLPQAPSRLAPKRHPKRALKRRNIVLKRMLAEDFITQAEYKEAVSEEIILAEKKGVKQVGAHFVEKIRQSLEKKYGADKLYKSGLIITTTLDRNLQKAAEESVANGLAKLASRLERKKIFKTPEAALIAISHKDGAIRAMVGGEDFSKSQFNRATQAKRQPGSAFKPILFLAALEEGYSPADILIDSPVSYGGGKTPLWRPVNYSNRFYGPVTLRTALEKSLNVSSIKLLEKVGIKKLVSTAKRLGIKSTLTKNLTLGLGSSSVTPLELTSAYGTIANGGVRAEPYFIESVATASGEILEFAEPALADSVRKEEAFLLTKMLTGVITNGTGKVAKRLKREVAGKTGTTSHYIDTWFVGFSPSLVASVWVGLDDNGSMGKGETGGHTAGPIWTDFMEHALKDHPKENFIAPDGVVMRTIDRVSGKLATPLCEKKIEEFFIAGKEPVEYCDIHNKKVGNDL